MERNRPLLTIVIPSYNMEEFLPHGLEKLLAASQKEQMEVIVVNDGSKDKTLEIAKGFEQRFPGTVKVINKENGHYGSCINEGLKEARGKYFRIMDADDWFEPADVDQFIDRLSRCEADLVVTFRTEVKTLRSGETVEERLPLKGVEYGKEYDATQFRFLQYAHGNEFNMHSMTYKTEILKAVGLSLPTGVCYTDLIYCSAPLHAIKTLMVFDIYLYHYRMLREGSSTTFQSFAKNLRHILVVMAEMLRNLEKNKSENPIVKENQIKYIKDDATYILLEILKVQRCVNKSNYALIAPILDKVKAYHAKSNYLDKWYFRLWTKTNSRLVLNASLKLYRLLHTKYWGKKLG